MGGIAAVFLDFDGVLVESVDIKTEAFRNLFSFVPSQRDAIVRYHLDNAGTPRFEKFRYIYQNILHKDLTEERFRELSERFSALVIDEVVRAPCVPGAAAFLARFSTILPLFVISATPEPELQEIVRRRRMERYFRGIFGSPAKKADNIAVLIGRENLDPERVVYVGDAVNDLNAAHQAGVRFIGRIRPGLADPFAGKPGVEKTVRDLDELSQYVAGHLP